MRISLSSGLQWEVSKTVNEPAQDYSEDGVDLTLIRWTLSLTLQERLQFLEERINEILAIRELNARK